MSERRLHGKMRYGQRINTPSSQWYIFANWRDMPYIPVGDTATDCEHGIPANIYSVHVRVHNIQQVELRAG